MPNLQPTFRFSAPDQVQIFVWRWLPSSPPKGAVLIVHGMAEHAGRYARMAEALTSAGFAVYGPDLRGHGSTAARPDDLGFLAARDGWRKCLNDLWQLTQRIKADYPNVPLVMLGHSMGSTLARQFMMEHGEALAGVVLSGASGHPTRMALAGRLITRMERLRLGAHGHSDLVRRLTFDAFNKRFQPARTRFDWLSRDAAEVNKYVNDPLCGFPVSVQLWIDLLDAWARIAKSGCVGVPRDLPIYVISGKHDAVSAGARMLQPMLEAFHAAGLQRVDYKFYPAARHELFNEMNREEVTQDLLS